MDLGMNILEEIAISLKIKIPSKFIFAALAMIQAATFYLTEIKEVPEFIYKIHTDKIVMTFAILVMICYDGRRKFRLLLTCFIACLFIFLPLSSFQHIQYDILEISHTKTNHVMLLALYPIVFSVCYYYHTYGIKLTNVGNQAFLSFWTPIIKTLMVGFYFIISTLVILLFLFVIKLTGFDYMWDHLLNINVIKAYIPVASTVFLWHIYKNPDSTENIIRGSAYLAHNLYKVIAPLGLIFVLSDIGATLMFEKVPDIDYRILFGVCLLSVLVFQLSNYPDENQAKSHPLLEKIILIYNVILPFIPVTYIFHLLTNFYEGSGDIICNQSILVTGINWGNFAPTLAAITLSYLTIVQGYYTTQRKEIMEHNLAVKSWFICIFYTICCVLAFNPYFHLNPNNNH